MGRAGDDLSQIAAEELGIDPARISVRHGDTESTAFGFGTFAARSIVMSGGAGARASQILRDKLCRIGAHVLQCEAAKDSRCDRSRDAAIALSFSAQPPEPDLGGSSAGILPLPADH
jgi:CO/xanthine dehydrogenase Mo-binding subunit